MKAKRKAAPFKKGDKVMTKYGKSKGKIGFKVRSKDDYVVLFPHGASDYFSSKQLVKIKS